MKEQSSSQKQQIQFEATSQFSTIWIRLKNSIFDVLFVLLDNSDEEQQSMIGLCFETGLDYLQMMSFPFSEVVIEVWNSSDTLNEFTDLINIINISSYLPGINFNTFLLMLYSLIFLIIVVICDIVYVAYSFSQKRFKFTLPLIFLGKIVPLIITVFFLPIMQTLLQVVNCQTPQQGTHQVLQSYPDVVCWQGWHLLHTTVTLIFSCLFVFISCVVTLTLFQPRMTSNRLTARQNSNGQVIFILNKIVCQFIFSFSPFQSSLPYCLMLFVLSAWLYSAYNIQQPYYNKKTSVFFRVVSTYYFWTNFMLLCSRIFSGFGFKDGLVIWSCGIIFIGITIIFQRKSNIDTLFSSNLKFKTGQQLESHLQYVINLHHNRNEDKNSYMLLLGYMEKHIQLCLEDDCPLRDSKKKFLTGKEQEQYSCQQLLKQIERMFLYGIKKYPECTKLQLSLAFFYMQKLNNPTQAYKYFTKALSNSPSFGEQFIIYRFKKILNEHSKDPSPSSSSTALLSTASNPTFTANGGSSQKQQSEEDLIELIRFDNHMSLCEQALLLSNKLHKQFWSQLKQQSPDLPHLNQLGSRIIATSQTIHENYLQIVRLSNDGPAIVEIQYNYAIYLVYIGRQRGEGLALMRTIQKKLQAKKRKEQRLQKQTTMTKLQSVLNTKKCLLVSNIQISENGDFASCKIQRVNRQTYQFLKYTQMELINQKIEKVLPQVYEDYHHNKVKQWFQQKKPTQSLQGEDSSQGSEDKVEYLGTQHVGFVRGEAGWIYKVKYSVHFVPLEYKFVTEFQAFSKDLTLGSIICSKQGQILQMTPNTTLKLPLCLQHRHIDSLIQRGLADELKLEQTPIRLKIQINDNIYREQGRVFEINIEKIYTKVHENMDTGQNHSFQTQRIWIYTLVSYHQISVKARNSTRHRKAKTLLTLGDIETNRTITGKSAFNKLTSTIDELYENPHNKYFVTEDENDPKPKEEQTIFRDYSKYQDPVTLQQKQIKIYRYFAGEYKRVYYDGFLEEDSSFDYEEKMEDIEVKLFQLKMQDKSYQERIKKAIKCFVYHKQVIMLLIAGLIIFGIFLICNFIASLSLLREGEHERDNFLYIYRSIQDISLVSEGFSELLFTNSLSPISLQTLKSHKISQTPFLPNLSSDLLWIQSTLVSLEDGQDAQQSTKQQQTTIQNEMPQSMHRSAQFLLKLRPPQLLQWITVEQSKNYDSVKLSKILLALMVGSTFIFGCFWVYLSIKIKIKVYRILVWFLDVPIQYVEFAQKQCSVFEKNYYAGRGHSGELTELFDYEMFIEEEKEKKGSNCKPEEQSQKSETTKSRQMQISSFNKKSLLSFLTFSQLFKFLLLFLTLPYLISIILLEQKSNAQTEMIFQSIRMYFGSFIQMENLARVIFMKSEHSPVNLSSYPQISQITQNIQNKQIYSVLSQMLRQSPSNAHKYFDLEYKDLCDNEIFKKQIGATNTSKICSQLALSGGFSVLKQHCSDMNTNSPMEQIRQFEKLIRTYVSPVINPLLMNIALSTSEDLRSKKQEMNILCYIYIIVVGFSFLGFWAYYTKKTNALINQSTKMLNIIPVTLLPVFRKQVREFIKQLLRRQIHEDQPITMQNAY